MTMTFPVANMRVSREMKDAEYALDEALLRHSSLLASMVTARRETGMDPFAGHEALLRLVRSQQSLLEAGGDLARVHGQLLDIQREMGGADACPPEETTTTGLVSDAAA